MSNQTISTTYGSEYLVLSKDTEVIFGTAMLGSQFGIVKRAIIKRLGERELIVNSAGELKLILIKTPGYELILDCAFDRSVVAPGMGESLSLPFVGVTGHVMDGASIAWDNGSERGISIPVSSWDSFSSAAVAYRLSPTTGERLSIGAVGLVAPSAGTTLNAVPSSISIALTWAAVARATSYEIQTRADSGSAWATLVTTGNQSYTHFGLISGTARDYRIRGVNDAGNGPWSDALTVETSELAPQTAPVITADVSPSSYDFTVWISSGVSGAEEYEFQRSSGGGVWTTVAVNADLFTTENVGAATTRLYRARALNSVGAGPWSSSISVTSTGMGAPVLTAVQSGNAIALAWAGETFTSLALATSYAVEYSEDDGDTWATLVTTTGNSATDSDIALDETRLYRVRGVNTTENGPWSDTKSATLTGLGSPSITTQVLARQIALRFTWLPVAAATGYELEINTDAGFDNADLVALMRSIYSGQISVGPTLVASNVTSVNTPVLATNTTYYARARLTTASGFGPWSNGVTVTTALAAISDLSWSSYDVTWTAPAGTPDLYRVYAYVARPFQPVIRSLLREVTTAALDTEDLSEHVDASNYAALEVVPVKNGIEGLPFLIEAINP